MIKLSFYTTKEGSIFMNELHKTIYLFTILFFTSFFVHSQGPIDGFSKGKNNFTAGLSYNYEKTQKFFAGTDLVGLPRSVQSFSFFSIYGVTNKLDVQLNIPYLNVGKGIETDFQDASLYLKYKFLNKEKFQLFGSLGGYLPLSDYQTEGGNALGQHNEALDIRLVSQFNLNNGYFLSTQGGYFFKTYPTPNALSASFKYGYASAKIYIDVWYEYYNSFGGTDYRGVGELDPNLKGGFKSLAYSYHRFGTTIYKPIKSFGSFINLAYTALGRNVGQGLRLGIGFTYNLYKQ